MENRLSTLELGTTVRRKTGVLTPLFSASGWVGTAPDEDTPVVAGATGSGSGKETTGVGGARMAEPSQRRGPPGALAAEVAAREPVRNIHPEYAGAPVAGAGRLLASRYFAGISTFARLRPNCTKDKTTRTQAGGTTPGVGRADCTEAGASSCAKACCTRCRGEEATMAAEPGFPFHCSLNRGFPGTGGWSLALHVE